MDDNLETVSVFDRNASLYAEKYFHLRLYDAHYDAFLESLPEGTVRILDLACGPGNASAYVRTSRTDASILAVDRSEAMLRQLQERVPGVATANVDCRDLSGIEGHFHGVLFLFGLSYFSDADSAKVLGEVAKKLRPDGSLLLATVAGDPALTGVHTDESGRRVRSFFRRPRDIEAMVVSAGFVVIDRAIVPSPANATVASHDSIVLARKPGVVP